MPVPKDAPKGTRLDALDPDDQRNTSATPKSRRAPSAMPAPSVPRQRHQASRAAHHKSRRRDGKPAPPERRSAKLEARPESSRPTAQSMPYQGQSGGNISMRHLPVKIIIKYLIYMYITRRLSSLKPSWSRPAGGFPQQRSRPISAAVARLILQAFFHRLRRLDSDTCAIAKRSPSGCAGISVPLRPRGVPAMPVAAASVVASRD